MAVLLIKALKCVALNGNQYSLVGYLEIRVNFVSRRAIGTIGPTAWGKVNFGTLHNLGCVRNTLS